MNEEMAKLLDRIEEMATGGYAAVKAGRGQLTVVVSVDGGDNVATMALAAFLGALADVIDRKADERALVGIAALAVGLLHEATKEGKPLADQLFGARVVVPRGDGEDGG